MKVNSTRFLFYYHKVLHWLLYISVKYFKTDNLFQVVYIISYLFSSILFIFSVFNSLNIMYTTTETINYLEEMDLPTELIDYNNKESNAIKYNNNDNNILFRFLKLFSNDLNITNNILPQELRNTYYIDNKLFVTSDLSESTLFYIHNKYLYKSAAYYDKIAQQIDILSDILNNLKSIHDNISFAIESTPIL